MMLDAIDIKRVIRSDPRQVAGMRVARKKSVVR
jgi:hypothetical protein